MVNPKFYLVLQRGELINLRILLLSGGGRRAAGIGGKKFLKAFAEMGGKNFLKVFAGGSEIFVFVGRGRGILKENLKLQNPSIKIIFGITSFIYFSCMRNTY